MPDIFEIRYGKLAAFLATITTVIAYTTIVSYQFRGGGKVLIWFLMEISPWKME